MLHILNIKLNYRVNAANTKPCTINTIFIYGSIKIASLLTFFYIIPGRIANGPGKSSKYSRDIGITYMIIRSHNTGTGSSYILIDDYLGSLPSRCHPWPVNVVVT